MSEALATTVRVPLAEKAYDVHIGHGILKSSGASIRSVAPSARRALVVHDPNVPASIRESLQDSLVESGFTVGSLELIAREQLKDMRAAESILGELLTNRYERNDVVIALGGGIVGDIAGFAASMYRRGIAIIQCPTTLLSMVDASVGGKTGVNATLNGRLIKNMVGSFHQPRCVIADVQTLDSLPEREFRAGLAECLKHAMIAKDLGVTDFDAFMTQNAPEFLRRSTSALVSLVAQNVTLKARVVCADEFEKAPDEIGGRALLNLGHTFGHVIETQSGLTSNGQAYEPLHGEAVALGLIAAASASQALWGAEGADPADVRRRVEELGLPGRVTGLPSASILIDRMGDDKKSESGTLRCVFPKASGGAKVVRAPERGCLEAGWREIGAWL
jgi:3-dehydroquinate synthase